MQDGHLVQHTSPKEIWKFPVNEKVAKLLYDINDYSELPPEIREQAGLSKWGKIDDLVINQNASSNALKAKVTRVEFLGQDKLYTLQPADCVACLKALAPATGDLQVGSEVSLEKTDK